jgi:hypothetical protein
MTAITAIYNWAVLHGTKVLGFLQVTIGTLAAATDIFSPPYLKGLLIANGLLVAWRGFFNSQQVSK